MKEWIMQYLVFSRKEVLGLTVLLVLIGAVWLLPIVFDDGRKLPNAVLRRADSMMITERVVADSGVVKIFELFRFDPNTIDDSGWRKLGLRPKSIATIRNYLSKGGRFRTPRDLEKIYGLRPDEVLRLMPYAHIAQNKNVYPSGFKDSRHGSSFGTPAGYNYRSDWRGSRDAGSGYNYPKRKSYEAIDINTADTAMFIALPGIGSKLAQRIVQFREKLGGFHDIMQVREVYGLQDSVFRIIKPYLRISLTEMRKININSVGFDSLNAHPYIQYLEARAIIEYRKQHGSFSSLDDLLEIDIVNREWLERVRPYINVAQDDIQDR